MFFKKIGKIIKKILYSFRYANIRMIFCESDCNCCICINNKTNTVKCNKQHVTEV